MDTNTQEEPEWSVDIDELTIALQEHLEEWKDKHFWEWVGGFPFTPKVPPPGVESLWVKFRYGVPTLEGEFETGDYAYYELAKRDEATRKSLRIPYIYKYVEIYLNDEHYSLIIMERVIGTPLDDVIRPTQRLYLDLDEDEMEEKLQPFKDRVVDALCFLLSIEPPPDAVPGPVGGGYMRSFVFGPEDSCAPRPFDSLQDFQDWVNTENEKDKRNPRLATADFLSEGLKFCYCDFHLGNFLLEDPDDINSRLIIIDFGHAGWMPFSFMVWETWKRREIYIQNCLLSRCGLEIHYDNFQALHNIRLIRQAMG